MKNTFDYRYYTIENGGGRYIARPTDGDDFTLTSVYILRVMRSIDALWDAIDSDAVRQDPSRLPAWIRAWIERPLACIDLDVVEGAAPPATPVQILSFPQKRLTVIERRTA